MTDQFSDAVRAVSGGFFLTMLVVLVMGMFGVRMPSLLSSGGCELGRFGWADACLRVRACGEKGAVGYAWGHQYHRKVKAPRKQRRCVTRAAALPSPCKAARAEDAPACGPPQTLLNRPNPRAPDSPGPLAIGISLVSAGLAAANLLLDFDFIRQATRSREVPRALEWYFAQSTLFTLVWFYTSVLRLLLLLSGARDE